MIGEDAGGGSISLERVKDGPRQGGQDGWVVDRVSFGAAGPSEGTGAAASAVGCGGDRETGGAVRRGRMGRGG